MLRRLLTPKWLGALLLAVLFAGLCFELGGWQWARHEAKVERNALLDAHYRADPVPVLEVISQDPLPPSDEWTRVEASGEYLAADQLYVRNRPLSGRYGYEILVPLRLTTGEVVVVDRGWVANSPQGADVLPPVPPVPTGRVDVVGWVRPSEPSRHRKLPTGQIASIDLAEVSEMTGLDLLPAYLDLDRETLLDGSHPDRPEPLGEPDRGLGPHQAYAYQWWLFMTLGFILVGYGIRRELIAEGAIVPAPRAPRTSRWDEEDA